MSSQVSYWEMTAGKTSSRCFLNGTIATFDFEYPVLDLGGGSQWSYHRFLDTDHERTVSVNLPRELEIDVAADAETTLPFKDEVFETVFCFNLLEHLYDYETTIAEMYRVLKPGGKVLIGVPFLNRIHGDPSDFTRFTEYRLRRDFNTFSTVEIHAHDVGPLSAACSTVLPLLKFNVFKYLAWRFANVLDRQIHRITDLFAGNYPLYYVVQATK